MCRSVVLMWAAVNLLGLGVRAQDDKGAGDALKKDAEAFQGRWERVRTADTSNALGRAKRVVKEIKGDRETVTWYGDEDQVIRSHRVTFKLSEFGKARVLTYSDMEVLDRTRKWTKIKATGSYIYRIEKDQFYEATGFLQDRPPYFNYSIWKKMAEKGSP
jgi:hypothetical protein